MRIVIDADVLINDSPGGGLVFQEMVIEMARRNNKDHFIFLTHELTPGANDLPGNVTVHTVKKSLFAWFGKKWWFTHRLANELKTLQADRFMTVDNLYANSGNINCCLFLTCIKDLMPQAGSEKRAQISHKRVSAAFRRANAINVTTEHDRQIIQEQFSLPPGKTHLWTLQAEEPGVVLQWAEKESVKTRYSGGREYFLFAGDLHERHCLLFLLKAYSQFKKWQQSNMQLILAGPKTDWTEELVEKISSFKYRNDVHVVIDPTKQTMKALIGCAYGFLYPALYDHLPANILRAMQASVPVITSDIPIIHEMAGNAVLYADALDAEAFSKSMQLIYKDEKIRTELIGSAKKLVEQRKPANMPGDCNNFLQQD